MRTSADQVLDELLVLRSQAGDAAALDELVRRWQPRLLRHAWHLTRDADAAAEVMQESWIALVRGITSLQDPALLRTWAYRIVTHKCADHARRRRRSNQRRDEAAVEEMPESRPLPLVSREEVSLLHAAMERLAPDQRAILSLRYWEQMSTAEIAAVLSIPAGTVKSRLHQARNEVKTLLERTLSHDATLR